jgi:hypothetical protein
VTGNEGVEDFSFGIVTDKKKEKKNYVAYAQL